MDNMNKNTKKNRFKDSAALRLAAAGAVLFLCAVSFVPAAGVLRTIPFFVIGGMAVQLMGAGFRTCIFMGALMTLCTYLATGRGVGEALLFAVVSGLLTASGMYIVLLAGIVRETEKKTVRKKGGVYIAVTVVISVVLSVVLCGNAVSFLVKDHGNTLYLKEKYNDFAEKRYTCYEPSKGEYCTYVSFKDGDDVYGNDDDCYISVGSVVKNDDIRNYFEEKMLYGANEALSSIIVGATWGFNVVSSDIVLDDGEIIPHGADVSDYLGRINYVVSFDSIIEKDEKDKFSEICSQTVSEISRNGFEFKNILFCGGDASKVLFTVAVTPETDSSDVKTLIKIFDERNLEGWNVSESDILNYWEN